MEITNTPKEQMEKKTFWKELLWQKMKIWQQYHLKFQNEKAVQMIFWKAILIDSKSISSDTEGSCDETKVLFINCNFKYLHLIKLSKDSKARLQWIHNCPLLPMSQFP